MSQSKQYCWVFLNAAFHFSGLSLVRRFELLKRYNFDPEALYEVLLSAKPPFPVSARLRKYCYDPLIDPQKELDACAEMGVDILPYGSQGYPHLLLNIPTPPLLLYVQGQLPAKRVPTMAIVGARKASSEGRANTRALAEALVSYGVTVISGLAMGVDHAAHVAVLDAGGSTVAVLGSGLEKVSGSCRGIARKIMERGALVSEFPLHATASQWTFPQRNRIISGLCEALLVVEAGERSGSLITVSCALEQGRDVLVVPGSINNPMARGCNRLIKQGADIVTSVADLADYFPFLQRPQIEEVQPNDADAELICSILDSGPLFPDQLLIKCPGLSTAQMGALLVDLELSGLVRRIGGQVARSN